MDSLRYWVLDMHVDASGSRPRVDARARAARRQPLGSFFDLDPAGSRHQPGEADRRAVGRGEEATRSQLPAACPNGRKVIATRCGTSARHRADARGVRIAVHRQLGSVQGTRAAAVREHQFVTAPTLHAPDLVSYHEKHNEPTARTTATARKTRSWNCGAEGLTDHPDVNRCGGARCGTHGHAFSLPGRADAVRRRRDRPHAARQQQRYCQDSELTWYDWDAAATGLLGFRAAISSSSRRTSDLHPAPVGSRDVRSAAARSATSAGFTPGGPRCPIRTGETASPDPGVFLNGSAIRTMDEQGRHVVGRTAFTSCSTPHSETVEFVLPESKWGEQWTNRAGHERAPDHIEIESGRQLSARAGCPPRDGRSCSCAVRSKPY